MHMCACPCPCPCAWHVRIVQHACAHVQHVHVHVHVHAWLLPLQVPMSSGTLFIFSPLDDLHFCHEAAFDKEVLRAAGAAGHRFVFVYRWLQSVREFYTAKDARWAMKLTAELQAREAEKKRQKSRKRSAASRAGLRRE